MTNPISQARALIESLGSPSATADLVTNDVVWHLYTGTGTPVTGDHIGRDAVETLHRTVFGEFYVPESVSVTINGAVGDETQAAIRFTLDAKMTWGPDYHTDYAVFVRTAGDKIAEVWEYLDSLAASQQVGGSSV